MSELQTCPKCGGKLKLSRRQQRGSLIDRRRDCLACGYCDRALVREEIAAIIAVAKKLSGSVRIRTQDWSQNKKPR